MQFSLITPERVLFSGDVQIAEVPGALGMFGVLPGHAPLISALKPGIITLEQTNGVQVKAAVADGIAEVTPERCVVLAENARMLTGVSPEEARNWLENAQTALAQAPEPEKNLAEKRVHLAEAVLAGVTNTAI